MNFVRQGKEGGGVKFNIFFLDSLKEFIRIEYPSRVK